jgi:spermidine synthase
MTLERAQGHSGELVLRRRGGHLEVVSNGAFLISSENEQSSRALVAAARARLPCRALDVLIGGLGLGYALDEALALPGLRSVTVAELEPVVVRWFDRYGGERARRASADGRARIVVADVLEVLQAQLGAWDLICLDTDNGPEWPVRPANAGIYTREGLRLARGALRRGGVAVVWSPERYPWFERLLEETFGSVGAVTAVDCVDGRRVDYTMYVVQALPRRAAGAVAPV